MEELFLEIAVNVNGDNQSMLCVLLTDRNPSMRHLSRTHRVSIAELHEQYHRNRFAFKFVRSEDMAADNFTTSMPAPHRGKQARRLIHVFESTDEFIDFVSPPSAMSMLSTLCVAVCPTYRGSMASIDLDTLHCSNSNCTTSSLQSHPTLAMTEVPPPGGVVTANPEEVLKRARRAFREDCALLVSILQANDNLSANTYLKEDLNCITKRYEAVMKELSEDAS